MFRVASNTILQEKKNRKNICNSGHMKNYNKPQNLEETQSHMIMPMFKKSNSKMKHSLPEFKSL